VDWKFEEGRVFCTDEKGELMAETTFVYTDNGEVDINHTFVNPTLRGQGLADKMMTVVADYLREKGLKATASCSYANIWLKRNEKSYKDIIAKDLAEQAVACRINGKH
jgi:predicted GNAT family acetyltransferase